MKAEEIIEDLEKSIEDTVEGLEESIEILKKFKLEKIDKNMIARDKDLSKAYRNLVRNYYHLMELLEEFDDTFKSLFLREIIHETIEKAKEIALKDGREEITKKDIEKAIREI